jgi:hypothetical protein
MYCTEKQDHMLDITLDQTFVKACTAALDPTPTIPGQDAKPMPVYLEATVTNTDRAVRIVCTVTAGVLKFANASLLFSVSAS